jgi:uncharacterized surface protein with fasciclin (FAS1) repeats
MSKLWSRFLFAASFAFILIGALAPPAVIARHTADGRWIAGSTEPFHWKEGFVREPRDVLNTLKSNELTSFQNFRDGLQQGYGLDDTLKSAGPFTVFAPTDRAFKRMSTDDFQALFANKSELRKVMSYHIVQGLLKSQDLKVTKLLNTMEGDQLKVYEYNGNLYVNDVLITTCDIPCTNGVVHVIERVLIPAPSH